MVQEENLVHKALEVNLVHKDQADLLDQVVPLDRGDYQDLKVSKDLRVNLDLLVHQAHQG